MEDFLMQEFLEEYRKLRGKYKVVPGSILIELIERYEREMLVKSIKEDYERKESQSNTKDS